MPKPLALTTVFVLYGFTSEVDFIPILTTLVSLNIIKIGIWTGLDDSLSQ